MDFDRRVAEVLGEENAHPEGWWYLSFAGDEGFRGACVVRGPGLLTAVLAAKSHGVNPGGEALAVEITGMELPEYRFRNRLLTLKELKTAFAEGVAHIVHDGDELYLGPDSTFDQA